jgi:RNA polymerase sigma-B factor
MDEGGKIANAARAEREHELLRRYHVDGDPRAKDQLAEEMLPLARALAGRYAGRGEPLDDLVQVACIGIMKAIEGFDLEREVRFSSYATPTVLGEIKRHFRDRTWAMRVPRRLQDLSVRIERVRDELTGALGREPTIAELAERLSGDPESILQALELAITRHPLPLEDAWPDDDGEVCEAPGRVDDGYARAEARAVLAPLLATLTVQEAEILFLRFREDLTQDAIARRVGLSQMHVSRLLHRSLVRLREAAA